MCDVERRIDEWRDSLQACDAFGTSDIDELEGHLRDEMERLHPLGLSETEAFLVARHRLGEPATLETEYAKVNANRRSFVRLTWMAAGILLYVLAGYIAVGVSHGVMLAAVQLGIGGYFLGLLGLAAKVDTAIALFLLGLLFAQRWSWSRFARKMHPISLGRAVPLLVALGFVDCVLIGSQILFRMLTARSLGLNDYGRIALVSSYANLGWTILAPLLAAILVFVLWTRADRYQASGPCGF